MTFCFAFSASPEGIAVVADTRISMDNEQFSDGYQKVIFPTKDSFIAVSGVLRPLSYLLENITTALSAIAFEHRIDFLRTHLRKRYIDGLEKHHFVGSPDDAFLIYGDVRLKKGPSRCRLFRFDFQFSDGKVVFGEKSSPNSGWQCIGSTPPIRRFLANTAIANLEDFEQRSLEIQVEEDITKVTGSRRPYQRLDFRGATFGHTEFGAVIFDTTGTRNGTLRKTLRAFANARKASTIDPIQVLGSVALQAIADQIAVFRNPPLIGIETISDTWSLATISRRNGIRLFTGGDPNGVLQQFGIHTCLR
jgi:hypothetical protein